MNSSRKISSSAIGTTIVSRLRGRDQVLELAAPADPVAGGQLHLARDPPLRLGDERAEVAAAHVGLHDDAALAVLAADLVGPRRDLDLRHGRQRHVARLRERRVAPRGSAPAPAALASGSGIGRRSRRRGRRADASGRRTTRSKRRSPSNTWPAVLAADGDLDDVLHVGDVEAVARERRAVELRRSAPAGR